MYLASTGKISHILKFLSSTIVNLKFQVIFSLQLYWKENWISTGISFCLVLIQTSFWRVDNYF